MCRVGDTDLKLQLQRFERCVIERDATLADAVLDDDFALVLVQPNEAVMAKPRWLEVLPDYVVDEWTVQAELLHDDGQGCAAVLQRVQLRATVLGEDRSGLFVISDLWRLRQQGWRVWRRHSTPLAAGSMPGATSP